MPSALSSPEEGSEHASESESENESEPEDQNEGESENVSESENEDECHAWLPCPCDCYALNEMNVGPRCNQGGYKESEASRASHRAGHHIS